jgi:F-type H+-transporting ATPase subunit delta
MSRSAVARRYAKALFEIARDENKLTEIADELGRFVTAYQDSDDFRELGGLPNVSDAVRSNTIAALGAHLKTSQTTTRTVTLLAQRQRLAVLPELLTSFCELSDEHQGIVRATVRAAKPLSAAYLGRLTKKIGEATGKTVVAKFEQDESLIAGVVTQIGDRIVDGSVRGKLDQLRQSLSET